jgi:hypothetical protein
MTQKGKRMPWISGCVSNQKIDKVIEESRGFFLAHC